MKARELEKNSPSLDLIYNAIKEANKRNEYKIFFPHWVSFSDECKLELMRQGVKLYHGEWHRGDYGFIIEW